MPQLQPCYDSQAAKRHKEFDNCNLCSIVTKTCSVQLIVISSEKKKHIRVVLKNARPHKKYLAEYNPFSFHNLKEQESIELHSKRCLFSWKHLGLTTWITSGTNCFIKFSHKRFILSEVNVSYFHTKFFNKLRASSTLSVTELISCLKGNFTNTSFIDLSKYFSRLFALIFLSWTNNQYQRNKTSKRAECWMQQQHIPFKLHSKTKE